MTVLITLTAAGLDAGPFNLFSNIDGYSIAFATNVSKSALLAGYTSVVVPDFTTTVRVRSTGVCTNFIDIPITGITTTTTTSSTTAVPVGYKIRTFSSGQNIYNSPCLGDEQWYTSEFYITIQLTELDGITPKINTTGSDIVITLKYEETGCSPGFYTRDAIIAPGQSQTVVSNKTGVAACPECINTAETIICYTSIVPNTIQPTQDFFTLCV